MNWQKVLLVLQHVQRVKPDMNLTVILRITLVVSVHIDIHIVEKTVIQRHVHQRHGQPREPVMKPEYIVRVLQPVPAAIVTAPRSIAVQPDIMAAAVMEHRDAPSVHNGPVQ